MNNLILSIINNEEDLYTGNLCYYLKVLFQATNVAKPYHNLRHMLHVTCDVYKAAKFVEYSKIQGKDKFRILLIAALFHDYDHISMQVPDKINIEMAIKAVNQYILKEDKPHLSEIEDIIRATEYPHNDWLPSQSILILRDADLSQCFSDIWLQQVVVGLAQEKGITLVECLEQQIFFISSIKFQMPWAIDQYEKLKSQKVHEVKELLRIVC